MAVASEEFRSTTCEYCHRTYPAEYLGVSDTHCSSHCLRLSNYRIPDPWTVSISVNYSDHFQSKYFDDIKRIGYILKNYSFPPVNAFRYAPLSAFWQFLLSKENLFVVRYSLNHTYIAMWDAIVVGYSGYFLLVNFAEETKRPPFFINVRTNNLHPYNFEMLKSFFLKPYDDSVPRDVTDYITTNEDLYTIFKQSLATDIELRIYEVIDLEMPNIYRYARAVQLFGHWVLVKYCSTKEFAWVHPKSGHIHPIGWCEIFDQLIESYKLKSTDVKSSMDRNSDCFIFEPYLSPNSCKLGDLFEMLDTFENIMRLVKVIKVLQFGYMLVEFFSEPVKQAYVHFKSHLLYPVGFSKAYNIPEHLTDYAIRTRPKPENFVFPKLHIFFKFKRFMVMETFNLAGPGVISYAIVTNVYGRLLYLKFIRDSPCNLLDWRAPSVLVDCESPNLLPFGFTHLMEPTSIRQKYSNFVIFDHMSFKNLALQINSFRETFSNLQDEEDEEECLSEPKSPITPASVESNLSQGSQPTKRKLIQVSKIDANPEILNDSSLNLESEEEISAFSQKIQTITIGNESIRESEVSQDSSGLFTHADIERNSTKLPELIVISSSDESDSEDITNASGGQKSESLCVDNPISTGDLAENSQSSFSANESNFMQSENVEPNLQEAPVVEMVIGTVQSEQDLLPMPARMSHRKRDLIHLPPPLTGNEWRPQQANPLDESDFFTFPYIDQRYYKS